MSAGSLRYTLVVRHPETGVATALLEGESVPGWASVLVHDDDLEGKPEPKATAKKASSSKSHN